jgi:hypothetical protein
MALARPSAAVLRADRQWPELVEGETPVRIAAGDLLDAVQLGLPLGSVDSFQVRVRWKESLWWRNSCRSRSRRTWTTRAGLSAR